MLDVIKSSPIEKISLAGASLFLKRDDLLHPDFSGNKARKFYYYLTHDFPSVHTLISWGSIQSNAMYSLSVLAKLKGWEFRYYVHHIPDYLKQHPHGNYFYALENGMRVIVGEVPPLVESKGILSIPEGGAIKESSEGIALLAKEILHWKAILSLKKCAIFLPSGTGTTALFLQRYLLDDCVYTTPCVGDEAYLKKQFTQLEAQQTLHPTILTPPKKYHFGKLYEEHYRLWLDAKKETGVTFDLLYDPLGLRVMLDAYEDFSLPLVYIHQGGLKGNESMLPRYERKYPTLF